MKKLFVMLCACIAGILSLNAQSRKALEDSVIVGGISRSMIDLVLDADQMKADEKLLAHWTYAEMMKEVSRPHLASFSDQELREILDYFQTNAYRFLSSDVFFMTYIENIVKAFQSESGAGAHFSYTLNDRSYGAGLEPIFQSTLSSLSSVLDEMLGEDSQMIANARRAGLPAAHIELMKTSARKVMANLFNIYKISVLDYLNKEDIKVVEDFSVSALGNKYAEYARNVKLAADLSSEDFINDFLARLEGKKINNGQLRTSVVEYVTLSRAFPECFPELVRPYAELVIGDSRYEGQTRDMRPYGKGKLTDKKGVVYEGDFKNGQRHGMMKVTKPGKQAVTQFWISDKYRKDVPVGKDKDGIVPAPLIDGGRRYGFGSVYDDGTRARYQGVFIDGQLNGQGKVYEPGRTVDGEFFNGKFVNGVMTWTSDQTQTVSFRGRMAGNIGKGIREWVAKDGSRKEVHIGSFQNGLLEGEGSRSVQTPNDMIESSGTFAYGKMYGSGIQRRTVEYNQNGIYESSVYEGSFFADRYHGQGRLTLSLENIPADLGTFTRCNVQLPELNSPSLEIVIEGIFDDGSFQEGKITYSDGSWYEGRFSEVGLVQGNMRRIYQDGSVYQGACVDGNRHGAGELYRADGSVFRGEFEYGEPVQVKVPEKKQPVNTNIVRKDELTFVFNNISAGYGKATLIKPAGVKIMVRTSVSNLKVVCKGRFRNDMLIEGKVTMSDGNWLEGVFEDGVLIQGRGKTVDKYRIVYEGDIKNGFPHGNGKCYYTDGTWFEGKFAWGNRMGGTHYAADGKVIKVYE